MDKEKDRDRALIQISLEALKEMHSPATIKFLANYLSEKHAADRSYTYIINHIH